MGLIVNGAAIEVPGLTTTSWKDDPKLRLKIGEDGRARKTEWIRGITIHTSLGIPGGSDLRPQLIRPGVGPSSNAGEKTALYWSTNPDGPKQAGAHLIVDWDGSVYQCADLLTETAYHAGPVNEVTIGIEIKQGHTDADLYQGQLDATVLLVDFLTATFGIQRQAQSYYHKCQINRLAVGGADVVGVYGHRDVTNNRGEGDPGNAIFASLQAAGYEMVDFDAGGDKDLWIARQQTLGVLATGVAGLETVAALRASGKKLGLWVERPIDKTL